MDITHADWGGLTRQISSSDITKQLFWVRWGPQLLEKAELKSVERSIDDSCGIKRRLGPFFEEGRHLKIDLVELHGFCLTILPSLLGLRLSHTGVHAGSCVMWWEAFDDFGARWFVAVAESSPGSWLGTIPC